MTEFLLISFVIGGAVMSYALGYFRERKVVVLDDQPAELPQDDQGSLRALYEAYSEEVGAKYLRNHARRRADKFLKEFGLASLHFFIFIIMAIACAKIDEFRLGMNPVLVLVGLIFLTMGLKAGQLTAAKETVEHKEALLHHTTDRVNQARSNMLKNCPSETWAQAMQIRDEKSPMHY